jgi:protein SCO1/2
MKKSIFLIAGFMVFAATYYFLAPQFQYQAPETHVASAVKSPSALKAFNLTDSNGNVFDQQSLRGHWTLVFFGYTHCPDICPRTLAILRETWQHYNKQHPAPVRFVFADISDNPATSNDLKKFLQNYNPSFIGISGSPEEMRKFSDQLGIYSQLLEDRLDHTAALLLIDPHARLTAVFSPPFSDLDLIHDLQVLTH